MRLSAVVGSSVGVTLVNMVSVTEFYVVQNEHLQKWEALFLSSEGLRLEKATNVRQGQIYAVLQGGTWKRARCTSAKQLSSASVEVEFLETGIKVGAFPEPRSPFPMA